MDSNEKNDYFGLYMHKTSVAVEVLGVSTRVGHRRCAHAFLHVGTYKVIAWALCSYIRSDCGNFVLSV